MATADAMDDKPASRRAALRSSQRGSSRRGRPPQSRGAPALPSEGEGPERPPQPRCEQARGQPPRLHPIKPDSSGCVRPRGHRFAPEPPRGQVHERQRRTRPHVRSRGPSTTPGPRKGAPPSAAVSPEGHGRGGRTEPDEPAGGGDSGHPSAFSGAPTAQAERARQPPPAPRGIPRGGRGRGGRTGPDEHSRGRGPGPPLGVHGNSDRAGRTSAALPPTSQRCHARGRGRCGPPGPDQRAQNRPSPLPPPGGGLARSLGLALGLACRRRRLPGRLACGGLLRGRRGLPRRRPGGAGRLGRFGGGAA